MTKRLPLTEFQATLPAELPFHMRRNIDLGEGGCWLWRRSRNRDGYGWASHQNKTYEAHRLIYNLLRGVPKAGLQLDHLCRVRHCVNPTHLEAVSGRENLARSELTPAGAVVCSKGHPLSSNGHQRRCPVCRADYDARNREARKEYMRAWRRRNKDQK